MAAAEIDPEPQAVDGVLADRLAQVKRAPGVDVGAGEDVRFQCVDTVAAVETKHDVVHSNDLKAIHEDATIGPPDETYLTARARR